MKRLFIFSVLLFSVVHGQDILCSQNYCEDYLTQNTCRNIPSNCNIQNATHNGIFLPFPGPCNCCDYCLENLNEDDDCPVGIAGSTVPSIICGSALSCATVGDVSTCQGMISDCTDAQRDYDGKRNSGELGHLEERPSCDRNGLYATYNCIPGEICYCLSEEGERIFGEIPFTSIPQRILNCQCSRGYTTASKLMGKNLNPDEFLRCQSNGDYDTLQCIEDNCFCVNAIDGSPSSVTDLVNITSISNETLHCFNNETHVETEYYRECEGNYIAILKEIEEYDQMGFDVFGYDFPSCQLDGYYAAVQRNATHAYCADSHGEVLENFALEVNNNITNNLIESMNCKCARSLTIAALDKPQCCPNGNYNPMQCRRGYCRCVDENGNQIVKEVPFENRKELSCFNACSDNIVESNLERKFEQSI